VQLAITLRLQVLFTAQYESKTFYKDILHKKSQSTNFFYSILCGKEDMKFEVFMELKVTIAFTLDVMLHCLANRY
jgi:choline kinase